MTFSVWPHLLYDHLELHSSLQCCLATSQGISIYIFLAITSNCRQVKTRISHKTAVLSSSSSSLPVDVLAAPHPFNPSQREVTLRPDSVAARMTSSRSTSKMPSRKLAESTVSSRPISTESQVSPKLTTDLRVSSSSMPMDSKDKLTFTSKSEICLPVRQLWNAASTNQGSTSEDTTSLSSNIQSTLTTHLPATDQVQQPSTVKTISNGMVYHRGNKSRSGDQLGKLQKWISEL